LRKRWLERSFAWLSTGWANSQAASAWLLEQDQATSSLSLLKAAPFPIGAAMAVAITLADSDGSFSKLEQKLVIQSARQSRNCS
jgi:hypothetical protein